MEDVFLRLLCYKLIEAEMVAILVIMEDVFLHNNIINVFTSYHYVAILVIMEDVFLHKDGKVDTGSLDIVAILVIMEDVFLRSKSNTSNGLFGRNPCYNGRCISTLSVWKI